MKRHHLLALTLYASVACAGHGMFNSFAGIAWLPEAGLTPVSALYRLDGWQEAVQLWRAQTSDVPTLCEGFAREKIAEMEVLIRTGNVIAVEIAITQYRNYLDRAVHAIAELNSDQQVAANSKFAAALLEHQYIATTDYLDLPRASRPAFKPMIEAAGERYAQLRAQLPRRSQDALFFKEEEVRWSREQADGADAQGL